MLAVPSKEKVAGAALKDRVSGAMPPANSTSGFDAKPLVNPWDFVLMLEGALLFGAAAVKRERRPRGAQRLPEDAEVLRAQLLL